MHQQCIMERDLTGGQFDLNASTVIHQRWIDCFIQSRTFAVADDMIEDPAPVAAGQDPQAAVLNRRSIGEYQRHDTQFRE